MAAPADEAFALLATRVAKDHGYGGWIGLTRSGRLVGNARRLSISYDGEPVRKLLGRRLPPNWDRHQRIVVTAASGPILGSNLQLGAILSVEGFVEQTHDGTIRGWAHAPNDPDAQLEVEVRIDGRDTPIARLPVSDPSPAIPGGDGYVQAHGFSFALPVDYATSRIHVSIGRHALSGSPLCPWPTILTVRRRRLPRVEATKADPSSTSAPPIKRAPSRAALDVIVPLTAKTRDVAACLGGILANRTRSMRVICVLDGKVDDTVLRSTGVAHARREITVLRHETERGVPAALNTGLSVSEGRDVLVLKSDVILPPAALDRLIDAAYSEPSIGTVTPLSTDHRCLTSITGGKAGLSSCSDDWIKLDQAARLCNQDVRAELPACMISCTFIRHDCLADVGLFEEDAFAQGSCEDADFSMRARYRGWRHIAACNLVVSTTGNVVSDPSGIALLARNMEILDRLHPGYNDVIADFRLANPLGEALFSLAKTVWAAGRRRKATVLVTHADGGGIERFVQDRATAIARSGGRAVIIRPDSGYAVSAFEEAANPLLLFKTVQDLATFLQPDSPTVVELHHLASHDAELEKLGSLLGVPTDIFVHDFAAVCPQVTMCGRTGYYCGEPLRQEDCTRCVETIGTKFPITGTVAEWRATQAASFKRARKVVAFSADTSRRLRRYMPDCVVHVQPPESDDKEISGIVLSRGVGSQETLRIAVLGALSVSKGYDVLVSCARDAAQRSLPITFTVVGHTIDDQQLMTTGRAFVTGRFDKGEAQDLLDRVDAHLGFIPSIWPETWCYALTELWRARLPVVAFDIGSQAARIKATGAGRLLPLHTPVTTINDVFMRLRHGRL